MRASRSLWSQTCSSAAPRPFSDIPGPKPLPLVVNIWRYLPIIGDYRVDTLLENALFNRKHYGLIVREKITSDHTILHLFDPKDIETFVHHDGRFPHRRSHRALLKYRHDRPELYRDGGLFPENGPSWQRQRNLFSKSLLSKSKLASNLEKLDIMCSRTLRRIEQQSSTSSEVVNIDDFESILYWWALGNSLSLLLDLNIEQIAENVSSQLIQQLHNSLSSTSGTEIQSNRWIEHPNKCPHYRTLVESQDFLHEFVSNRLDSVSESQLPSQCASYLHDWLIKDRMDRQDVTSLIIDSLMAGLHTTSYTIAQMIKFIAEDVQVQAALIDEVDSRLSEPDSVSIEQIDKSIFLRDCLKETMRLRPPSIGTGRVTTQPVILSNYTIPVGTMVITQNEAISLDDAIYDEADKFKPDRWAKYRQLPVDQKPSPFATLPFGFGARACIGQRSAELQIKLMVARLLKSFKILRVDKIPTKTTLIHNLDGPFKVKLRKRNRSRI